jgi:hypothetical protein
MIVFPPRITAIARPGTPSFFISSGISLSSCGTGASVGVVGFFACHIDEKTGKATTIVPSTAAARALIPKQFIRVSKAGLNPLTYTNQKGCG